MLRKKQIRGIAILCFAVILAGVISACTGGPADRKLSELDDEALVQYLAEHDISIPADLEASAIRDAIAGLEAEPDRDAPVVGWTEYAAFYEELRGLVKAYDQITP